MKYLTLLICLISTSAFAQFNVSILDQNNTSAYVTDGGLLFNDPTTSQPGYEVPKGSGNNAIYSSALWFGGLDANGQLHLSGTKYNGGQDIFPGPIADSGMYSSADYLSEYTSSIWHISKSDIDNHILNWDQPGYSMSFNISNWPGNGDPTIGVAEQLAPYVDVNNNGVYEPSLGDYPNIRGDEARYIIMNDAAQAHASSGGDPLGIEVHLMVYQYATSDYINDITFINARVFNRGNVAYQDFRMSYYVDGDLGNPNDDYMGSDPSRNMMFTYNGDLNDEGYYGANPPAIGVVSLSQTMSGAGYFSNGGPATQSDPSAASDYWNYMNNKWKYGDPWVYGGTGFSGSTGSTNIPTAYMFSSVSDPAAGFEWNEETSNNPAGDRRMFMNIESDVLPVGADVCYDLAVVYAQGGPNLFSSVTNLETNVDQLQVFFDAQQNYTCETVTVGNEELSLIEATIYPNPSSGDIHVVLNETIDQFSLKVLDVSGRVVYSNFYQNQLKVDLDLSEYKGVYLIQLITEEGTTTERVLLD